MVTQNYLTLLTISLPLAIHRSYIRASPAKAKQRLYKGQGKVTMPSAKYFIYEVVKVTVAIQH